ncbi:tetratricopeptide repeat protein [bacterium]|nr:tetratricopeptide repeat protein [bacterium]MCI0602198.1 tetratricopeptide repeat protein [bacterium]
MKFRFLFLFFLLISVQVFAAAGKVRGTVKDVDGKPIDKATITISSTGEISQKYTAHTNAKGEYIHIGVFPGEYRVTVSKEGYKPVEYEYADVRVTLADKGTTVDFKMQSVAAQQKTQQPAASEESPAVKEAKAGLAALNGGKLDEAIAAFEKALQLDSTLVVAHYNLGAAYERKDNLEKARQHFQEAVKLKPDFGEGYLAIGNSYLAERKFDSPAIDALTKATELLPQNYNAFYNLGVCYSNSGKYVEAESAYRKAVEINPKEPVAHYQLAMALLGQSKSAEAKSEFQKYLELNPNAADRKEVEELMSTL